jgi:hypothetical protein
MFKTFNNQEKEDSISPNGYHQKNKKQPGSSGSWLQSYLLRKQRSGGSQLEGSPGKKFSRSYLENIQHKRAGRVAQVVECLPNKCDALSSNPGTIKKKAILAMHQWLIPKILATQKAKIRRIAV